MSCNKMPNSQLLIHNLNKREKRKKKKITKFASLLQQNKALGFIKIHTQRYPMFFHQKPLFFSTEKCFVF